TIVVRLASSGTVNLQGGSDDGTGYTIYSNSFLLTMVPHSIITVSLATAMLPMLSSYAASGNLAAVGSAVSSTLRSAYALVVPIAALFTLMALDIAQVIWGYGSAAADFGNFAPSLALFGIGMVLFTAHYLMLRGFYALEQTRRVFFIQCGIAATNIVAALLLTHGAPASEIAPRLVIAYTCSYAVGAVTSYTLLSREVGGLDGRRTVRFLVRLVIAVGISAGVGLLVYLGLQRVLDFEGTLRAVLDLAVVGLAFFGVYFGLARLLRITEVTEVLALVGRRVRGRR
ncbi:MAG: lipid II flippase MurJ, partial [Marmoricola sp.]